jgi:hypothetical protein
MSGNNDFLLIPLRVQLSHLGKLTCNVCSM